MSKNTETAPTPPAGDPGKPVAPKADQPQKADDTGTLEPPAAPDQPEPVEQPVSPDQVETADTQGTAAAASDQTVAADQPSTLDQPVFTETPTTPETQAPGSLSADASLDTPATVSDDQPVFEDETPQSEPPQVTVYIQFDVNSSKVTDSKSVQQMDEAGQALASPELSGMRFEIAGHTDSTGPKAYNLKLSEARAKTVKDYIVRTYGVDASRLVAKGYGESLPVEDNSTSQGRAKNRRVVFILLEP